MRLVFSQHRALHYAQGLSLQSEAGKRVAAGNTDEVLLVEHTSVYTFGKSANKSNLLISAKELKDIGAEVFHTQRGGDITYHGPGQLVGYPILDLHRLKIGARTYIESLEAVIIQVLAEYGIKAYQINGLTGIWTKDQNHQDAKVGAIGVRISKGITSHGFALNVNTNLDYFNHIVPCGIEDKAVTSISKLLNRQISWDEVAPKFENAFFQWHNATKL
jgi:lipoyl(octanoyl) transferase